jgi:hypothetical protein
LPVARDSVHLADEIWGHKPTWQLAPTSCDYKPIWGNAIDYFIRLDQ